jgi:hypothetical protein
MLAPVWYEHLRRTLAGREDYLASERVSSSSNLRTGSHSDCESPQTLVVYALTDRQLARSKWVSFSIISLISGTSFCSSGSDRAV